MKTQWKMVDGFSVLGCRLRGDHGDGTDCMRFGVFVGEGDPGVWWVAVDEEEKWRLAVEAAAMTTLCGPFTLAETATQQAHSLAKEEGGDRDWVPDVLARLAREDAIDAATVHVRWGFAHATEVRATACELMAAHVRMHADTGALRAMVDDEPGSKLGWIAALLEAGYEDTAVEQLVLAVDAACVASARVGQP